jgi:hypothetical protein
MFSHRWSACAIPLGEARPGRVAAHAAALIALLGAFATAQCAHAHGIAGNRLFPGTLSFDDPAVADEFALTPIASAKHPGADGSEVKDQGVSWSFMRLLTPTVAVGVDNGWIHRNWGGFQRSGFATTNLTIKTAVYRNDLHEMLVSASLSWGIGHSGAQGVGRNLPDIVEPGIFFGKGFGDLPDSLAWLRPFAITGAITAELPASATSTNIGIDPATGQLAPMVTHHVDTLHWGFSVQYSPLYLTDRFKPGRPPKDEPLNQWVPLIEFAFTSPRGEKTAATVNPGLSYVANT